MNCVSLLIRIPFLLNKPPQQLKTALPITCRAHSSGSLRMEVSVARSEAPAVRVAAGGAPRWVVEARRVVLPPCVLAHQPAIILGGVLGPPGAHAIGRGQHTCRHIGPSGHPSGLLVRRVRRDASLCTQRLCKLTPVVAPLSIGLKRSLVFLPRTLTHLKGEDA